MTKRKNKRTVKAKADVKSVGAVGLKYKAIESDTLRRPIYVSSKSEDRELTPHDRLSLISDARDSIRNFTLAGFVVRKHLQSISYYRFFAGTPDATFNRYLEGRVNRWKKRHNCDAAGRHGLETLLYLIEAHRAIDGDVGICRLSNGKIQIIEGDRIRTPAGGQLSEEWEHGVRLNSYGRALAYAISKRTLSGGFEHERYISASNFDLLGYFTREDQVRGVSLLAPAARMFAQLYDAIDLALAKIKVEQALCLVTKMEGDSNLSVSTEATEQERRIEIDQRARDVFGPGLVNLGLRTNEDANLFQTQNPSQNFQSFCEVVIRLVFAAFDIPYSFYDGSAATFFSQRGEFEQYIDGVEKKQAPTIEMLNEWISEWLLPNWITDEEDPLILPERWTIDDVMDDCGWTGAGLPTWRMLTNVKDLIAAIQAGLVSPSEAIREYGYDPRKNLDDVASLKEYAKGIGIIVPYGETTNTNLGL